ncbi:MAG: polyamine aminopropyltransferase [Atribacterota bacterium]|nr:polyamine aminopropyltransferase [Candidatus Atribacteria bacterium]
MELWYYEDYITNYRLGLRVKETLFSGKTRFQEIAVLDTWLYGRTLLLDGIVQTTEKDEFMYHEMIVHPALVTVPKPKNVLIVGGGDGGASREILKHPVDSVTLVDIDEGVIDISRQYFPQLGNWKDSRLSVYVEDAVRYMAKTRDVFDVIIMDSTDPLPSGVAEPLFSRAFFQDASDHLSEDGVLVSQIEPPFFHPQRIQKLWQHLDMFPIVKIYWGLVPTYPGGVWTYIIASKKHDPQKVTKNLPFSTRYYSRAVHEAAFILPVFLAEMVKRESDH